MILYYGTPDKVVTPRYGCGDEKHDYGKGFYLAGDIELAKEFVRDNIDTGILEELLRLGNHGIQYCIKSERAYSKLTKAPGSPVYVDHNEFRERYNQRDTRARENMCLLIDSDANKVTNVFSTLLGR